MSPAGDKAFPQWAPVAHRRCLLNVPEERLGMLLHERAHFFQRLFLGSGLNVPAVFKPNAVQHKKKWKKIKGADRSAATAGVASRSAAVKVETRMYDLDGENGLQNRVAASDRLMSD